MNNQLTSSQYPTVEGFSAFASLNRYFNLAETTKPTLEQAEQACELAFRVYEAESEEQVLKSGNDVLIDTYKTLKKRIMDCALEEEGAKDEN